jgi:hypothetical protein
LTGLSPKWVDCASVSRKVASVREQLAPRVLGTTNCQSFATQHGGDGETYGVAAFGGRTGLLGVTRTCHSYIRDIAAVMFSRWRPRRWHEGRLVPGLDSSDREISKRACQLSVARRTGPVTRLRVVGTRTWSVLAAGAGERVGGGLVARHDGWLWSEES